MYQTVSAWGCRYFSGEPAAGLPHLNRTDGTVRPNYEALLVASAARDAQYYAQYVRPATMRAFKHMQVAPRAERDENLSFRMFDVQLQR